MGLFRNRLPQICFAVLVHNKRNVILDLLDNIRCFCPNSSVVLYNGGNDSKLCNNLGVPVCPTSRKLKYGVTAIYMLETMSWLEDIHFDYEYLINLDSDALFVREGFESFIAEQMKGKDYMGVETKKSDNDSFIGNQVRAEFDFWKSVFEDKTLYESFNVGQVFSRRLVRRFLGSQRYSKLKDKLNKTRAFGIDEVAYVTLTKRFGFALHAYPRQTGKSIRYRPYFPLDETVGLLHRNRKSYLLHPVPREMRDETRVFVRNTVQQLVQYDANVQKRFLDTYIGDMPFYIRRKESTGQTVEWIAASLDTGLSYWRSVRKQDKVALYGPYHFGKNKVDAFTAIESHYGNIELICRINDKLTHYWRDEKSSEWFEEGVFAEGVKGSPAIIESAYGNFEVVAPLQSGGLGHWWRNNHSNLKWARTDHFGKGHYYDVILVENNSRQLTAVAKTDDGYRYFVRDDRHSWRWLGPFI